MPWLGVLLANLLGSAVARVLTGAGLGLVTYVAMRPLVMIALTELRDSVDGIGGSVVAIIYMSGLGEALTAIGSAILTRVAINAGRVALSKVAQ